MTNLKGTDCVGTELHSLDSMLTNAEKNEKGEKIHQRGELERKRLAKDKIGSDRL